MFIVKCPRCNDCVCDSVEKCPNCDYKLKAHFKKNSNIINRGRQQNLGSLQRAFDKN